MYTPSRTGPEMGPSIKFCKYINSVYQQMLFNSSIGNKDNN